MTRLESLPPGFDAGGVVSFRLVAPRDPYADVSRLNAYVESVERHLRQFPGVTHVAFAESLPPDSCRKTLVGVGIGSLAALGLTRSLTAFLFRVTPADGWIYASTTAALLLFAATLASLLPALRAARSDPSGVLREQ